MSSRLSRTLWLGFVLLCTACMGSAEEFEDGSAQPVEQVVGGISFISGGIGADERALLAARAAAYNLVLIFRLRNSSEALTDVAVSIATPKGEVLVDTLSEGPMFLARLPKGRYVLQAVYDGKSVKRAFVLGSTGKSQGRRFILRWSSSAGK